jgi:magnesium chelatase family protein
MDRIDIHVDVPAVQYKDLIHGGRAEGSDKIRQRIDRCRALQASRLKGTQIFCNAQMSNRHIKRHCGIDKRGEDLLETAIDKLGLSARAFNRILKIARTIADLEGVSHIQPQHVSEAIQYRSLDRDNLSV